MQMGYRHAWDLVDEINRLAPQPLVIKETGGSGGGGSRLTPEGKAAVANFWKLVERFNAWLKEQEPQLWLSKPEGASSTSRSSSHARTATRKTK
jgi:molybdate transport repressor ModE-like protein